MIKLGLDFDNTIINYEDIFHKVALERGLIPENLPPQKKIIRQFLIEKNIEDEFTLIQAEVYGKRIMEAKPANKFIESIIKLKEKKIDIDIYIVSHKTKYPYKGPKYDLHDAAMRWLDKNNFFNKSGLDFECNNIFFEISINDKIKRIESLNLNYFIDDLPKILEMINSKCQRILYDPNQNLQQGNQFLILQNWENLNNLIF